MKTKIESINNTSLFYANEKKFYDCYFIKRHIAKYLFNKSQRIVIDIKLLSKDILNNDYLIIIGALPDW